jgi:hypothetical protein
MGFERVGKSVLSPHDWRMEDSDSVESTESPTLLVSNRAMPGLTCSPPTWNYKFEPL